MATTTNYGWETPDDTDLVKDGALAQRTTASAIDTSMYAALSGKPAMGVLLNSTSFTNASTVAFNNVFSSSYSSYRIIFQANQNASTGSTNLQFTIGGTATGTSNYGSNGYGAFAATAGTIYGWQNNQAGSNLTVGDATAGNRWASSFDIINPALADYTFVLGSIFSTGTGAGASTSAFMNGMNSYTTAGFDGFKITTSAGTITGTAYVYGYRKV